MQTHDMIAKVHDYRPMFDRFPKRMCLAMPASSVTDAAESSPKEYPRSECSADTLDLPGTGK